MAKDNGKVLIHGKEYETVASRVQKFRETYKADSGYSIRTELVEANEKTVIMKALILKGESISATGYAEENRASSSINRTSALENCETSAIGRALAAFGMAGTEYASADEVAQAISQQKSNSSSWSERATQGHGFAQDTRTEMMASQKQREFINTLLNQLQIPVEEQKGYLLEQVGVDVPLTKEGASFAIEHLTAQSKEQVTVNV